MQSNNTVVMDVAVRTEAASILPMVVNRVDKNGRGMGQRVQFCQVPAAELRKKMKGENPKASGKEVSRLVNDCLTGRKEVRRAMAEFWLSSQWAEGFVPDYSDVAKNGKVSKLVLVKPVVAVEKAVAAAEVVALTARAETAEQELLRLKAENAALKAAAQPKS